MAEIGADALAEPNTVPEAATESDADPVGGGVAERDPRGEAEMLTVALARALELREPEAERERAGEAEAWEPLALPVADDEAESDVEARTVRESDATDGRALMEVVAEREAGSVAYEETESKGVAEGESDG